VGQVIEPLPVKLIMGLIIGHQAPVLTVRQRLEASYGRVDLETDLLPSQRRAIMSLKWDHSCSANSGVLRG